GYTAIAVALLARLHPLGVVAAGLFFGALEGGGRAMERDAGVSAAWVDGIEALVILAVLAAELGARRLGAGAGGPAIEAPTEGAPAAETREDGDA
ncbi:MAG: ABC transporter permease, partial [Gemmatimonadetes bacterium]